MVAASCLTLSMIYLVIGLRGQGYVQLLFATAALAVAGIAAGELAIMLSQTPEQIGTAIRWIHVPIFIDFVANVWFVRLYFGTGRRWLAWLICIVRGTILILNFCFWPNFNYAQITGLRSIPLWGTTVTMPVGVLSAWTRVGELSSLLLLIYVIDASVRLWRHGRDEDRHRAMLIGGAIVVFVVLGAGHVALIHAGLMTLPYMISFAFMVPVLAMGYQLGSDVARAGRLSRDLKLSRAALHENERRMELAASAAQLGLWRWDIPSDIVWVSDQGRALLELNGAVQTDLRGFLSSLVPEDRKSVQVALDQALSSGTDYQCEFRVRQADGDIRWISSRGRAEFSEDRAPLLMRGVCFDVTQRRHADREQARQRRELTHLSRVAMMGELSGSLAHELNQPLTAILSNAQAAQEFFAQDATDLDEVRGILQDIVDEARRAREVIRRLRQLFRKESSEHGPLDVNEVILEVLKLMNGDLINHGVVVRTELAADLPAVIGDRVQLQQVCINLLSNAVDAMAMNNLSDRLITVASRPAADRSVEICFSDCGCGIPHNQLEQVFEPFHTTKPSGMGLGLAVCSTILSAHAGKIWARNKPDRGASLHVLLPCG